MNGDEQPVHYNSVFSIRVSASAVPLGSRLSGPTRCDTIAADVSSSSRSRRMIVLAPAALIILLTFAVQILGDWIRDRADVRLRER